MMRTGCGPASRICTATAACLLLTLGIEPSACRARAQGASPEELVAWLDSPETEWVATARLQAVADAAIPLLLQPARIQSGAHDRWTAQMLALAKLGEPAIPPIATRLATILGGTDPAALRGAAHPLIKVLGSMGPAAVPALLDVAEASSVPAVAFDALDEVARLEPRTTFMGHVESGWSYWRPMDDRLNDLARELAPQLPRVRKLMERGIREWKPQGVALQRPAAYLLARWGAGEARARGLEVLDALARADEPFYRNLEAIRLLHDLRAPQTAELIRLAAAKVPDSNNLKPQYLLTMTAALYQVGDRNYGPLLASALGAAQPYVRMDALRFIAASGDLSNAPQILPLLEDRSAASGLIVGNIARDALRRLTLEQFDTDRDAWSTWLDANRGASRADLVARRVNMYVIALPKTPIKDANRWIAEFNGSDGAAVLPLIDRYLDRRDLQAGMIGGGSGPIGAYGPRVVTLLLDMAMRQVPGALQRLTACLEAADPDVRMFGALALSAFDKPRAIERLVKEAAAPEEWHRHRASELLLLLGDKRGIPGIIERLISSQKAARIFACRDLRIYTQQPLSCDANASLSDQASNVAAWRTWWQRAEPTFRVKSREAALDLEAFPISPVQFGNHPVK
jgi:hypothetical protein